MDWPDALVRELAARRCAVFLGAGASAGAVAADGIKHPPGWSAFLGQLLTRMRTASERIVAEQLINEYKYLDAAELMHGNIPAADFTQFIRDELVNPRYSPSDVHRAVLEIDPKVVVTTNYDDIYERYCQEGDATDGYNVCRYYDSHLVSDMRSPVRMIVKAHGCVNNPGKIVLTRSQYYKQRRDYANFFRTLDGLFITSTLFFVGYSLSDPDIQLVLENASIAAPESHPHYAVIPNDVHVALKRSWGTSYNIHFLEYPAGDFGTLNQGLAHLAQRVVEFRATRVA